MRKLFFVVVGVLLLATHSWAAPPLKKRHYTEERDGYLEISPTEQAESISERKNRWIIFAAAGAQGSFSTGVSLIPKRPQVIDAYTIQFNEGSVKGDVSYNLRSIEGLIVDGNFRYDEWNSISSYGIGFESLTLQSNYTDQTNTYFHEQEDYTKTYFKVAYGLASFYRNGLELGFDVGLLIPLSLTSKRSGNANGLTASSAHPTYGETHQTFETYRQQLATGVTFQINVIKLGWYF